ncbi:hypothetical protein CBL_03061 [Carabus blaptoides fortunei]
MGTAGRTGGREDGSTGVLVPESRGTCRAKSHCRMLCSVTMVTAGDQYSNNDKDELVRPQVGAVPLDKDQQPLRTSLRNINYKLQKEIDRERNTRSVVEPKRRWNMENKLQEEPGHQMQLHVGGSETDRTASLDGYHGYGPGSVTSTVSE